MLNRAHARLFRKFRIQTGICGYSKERSKSIGLLALKENEFGEKFGNLGEDAFFINKTETNIDTFGVADGVGGWRLQGVDPSIFSSTLMDMCLEESFTENCPKKVLVRAIQKMQKIHESENHRLLGSSTAVTLTLDKEQKRLSIANLGDSGVIVIRDGESILRTSEQTHRFNCPYQLSLPTPGYGSISDSPHQAESYNLDLLSGDIIIAGTDGLFDNVPDSLIIEIMRSLTDENLSERMEELCQLCLAIANDNNYLSPFAIEARKHGYPNEKGGKMDDLTVVVQFLL